MEKEIWYKNVETGERIECTIAPVVVVNRDKIAVESKKPTVKPPHSKASHIRKYRRTYENTAIFISFTNAQ